jgi:hypothetical protein
VDICLAHSDIEAVADLEDAMAHLRDGRAADPQGEYHAFLSSLVNRLAEDKRFELLRVSPTRFPILWLAVWRQSGPCVTRHDRTRRTVPAAAERPRMRRKLRRTGRRAIRLVMVSRASAYEIETYPSNCY